MSVSIFFICDVTSYMPLNSVDFPLLFLKKETFTCFLSVFTTFKTASNKLLHLSGIQEMKLKKAKTPFQSEVKKQAMPAAIPVASKFRFPPLQSECFASN